MKPFACCALVALALAAGCSDQPYIYMLTYSPNATFVDAPTMITGDFKYSSVQTDISQWVVEVSTPDNQLLVRTAPQPIETVTPGGSGDVTFTLMLQIHDPGLYRFFVWLVDLDTRESNHLTGLLRVATMDPYGPMNP